MNPENLTPFNQMDSERQREIARMGGIASGVTRRRRAVKRKAFCLLLQAGEQRANREKSMSELRANSETPGQEKVGLKHGLSLGWVVDKRDFHAHT